MSVPSPVINVLATAGNGMVRVTFDPPTTNGGSAILSYTATATAAGPITVGVVTNLAPTGYLPMGEFVFGRLTNNAAVTVSIVATNVSGDSTPVVSNTVTPIQLPGQLPNVITVIMGEMAYFYLNYVQATCPRMRFGKKYTAETEDFPYVHFVPGRAEIEGPSELGSGAPGSPRQLWTKRQHITATCWGGQLPTGDAPQDYLSGYGQAEAILNNVAAAIHECSFGSELAYSDEFAQIQDNSTRGVGISLDFSVFLPITEFVVPAGDVATLTDFDQTNDL